MLTELAIETGIPPSVWAGEDERFFITALNILKERSEAIARGKTRSGQRAPGAGGPKYSG